MNCKNCHKCLETVMDEYGLPFTTTTMVVCEYCGNKRCPHATDHELACTHSNDPEQVGSIYSNYNFKTAR